MENLLCEAYTTLRKGSAADPKEREEARKFVRRYWDQPDSRDVIMKVLKKLDIEEKELNEIYNSQ